MTAAPTDLRGLEGILGEAVRVLRFPHETPGSDDAPGQEWTCDVVVADGVPARGYTTYATVGVRTHPTLVESADGRELRTELVGVGRTADRAMVDVLDACALAVAGGAIPVRPGAVVPDAVAVVAPGRTCGHVVLVPPFLWPELVVVEEPEDPRAPVVTRLQAVPVTDAELRLVARSGHEALFVALESARADVTDLDRRPVC